MRQCVLQARDVLTFEDLNGTIDSFYSAATGEVEWSRPLAQLTDLCGGVAATLELVDLRQNQSILFESSGINPASVDDYTDHFQMVASRVRHIMRAGSPDICFDLQSISEYEMDNDEFYADFLAPENMRYYISGRLIQTGSRFGLFSIQRSPRQGHVGDRDVAMVKQILPHIRRALDLSLRLKESLNYTSQLENALDHHSDGVVLIAGNGTVAHANSAAGTIFRRNNGISIRDGHINFFDRSLKKNFDTVMQSMAINDLQSPWPQTELLAARTSGGAPYALSIFPANKLLDEKGQGYLAIIFIRDLARLHDLSRRRLQKVLGLTSAEAQLATWIGKGRPLDAYARRQKISLNTVYTHLRHLKDKTGCRSQMALVAKIRQIAI